MAISALNLPTDIPWERVCVTTDMVDSGKGPAETPPLWQTSMALFRYVPPDEYQNYPGRRIVYYKLAATITNYQPKSAEILGTLDSSRLSSGTLKDEEVKRRLTLSLPCTAAIVQVTVTPQEADRAVEDFPYFMDVQPRQRALYEQVTETQERASRSLETLQIRKDAGSSNSVEVLDVDQGGTASFQYAGAGGGLTRSGQWGSRSLGKEDSSNVRTTDSSRESRETLAFTAQLSQMYTLLQAYHIGTNRVFFYIAPRPHAVEPPTGIAGPRKLDGVQDLFLVVNQRADQGLPCITARLDTGHLDIRPRMGFDSSSQPPQTLTVTCSAPAPLRGDPAATPTQFGSSTFYGCLFKTATREEPLSAPAGYVIDKVVDIGTPIVRGNSNFANSSNVELLPNSTKPRQVMLSATATGYACHRNEGGDIFNFFVHPSGEATGTEIYPDTWTSEPGLVQRSVSVSFRSEVANVKLGDEYVLALTTRQLRCCETETGKSVPPKIVEFVPMGIVPFLGAIPETAPPPVKIPIPPVTQSTVEASQPATYGGAMRRAAVAAQPAAAATQPAAATGAAAARTMTMAQANALQQRLVEETQRLSMGLNDVVEAPARDGEFMLHALVASVLDDPRRFRTLSTQGDDIGLSGHELERVAEAMGHSGEQLNRFDVATAPDRLLQDVTGLSGADLARIRLRAVGLPTKGQETRGKTDTKRR